MSMLIEILRGLSASRVFTFHGIATTAPITNPPPG